MVLAYGTKKNNFFHPQLLTITLVNLDEEKLKISQRLVNEALDENSILISPIILQEMIFTLGKLRVEPGKPGTVRANVAML